MANHRSILLSCIAWVLPVLLLAQDDLEKGKALYAKRAEGANGLQANAATIDQAITHFKNAIQNSAQEEEAAIYLLRCYYYKGAYTPVTKDQSKAIFAEGKTLGDKMLKKYPNSPGLLYWHFVDLGKWGEAYGKVAAAKEGVADQLKEVCERLIKADPNYEKGGGYRLLGILHFEAPYIPFVLSWPDDKEAQMFLEKALEKDPNGISVNLYYAKVLEENGKKDQAIANLKKLVNIPPRPTHLLEDKEDLAEGQALLAKWQK